VVGVKRGGADVDVHVVSEEIFGQSSNLFRPCCGPHQDLTIGSNLLNDFPDLRFETHVQHPERLIRLHHHLLYSKAKGQLDH
jgi:hypothetical protein